MREMRILYNQGMGVGRMSIAAPMSRPPITAVAAGLEASFQWMKRKKISASGMNMHASTHQKLFMKQVMRNQRPPIVVIVKPIMRNKYPKISMTLSRLAHGGDGGLHVWSSEGG